MEMGTVNGQLLLGAKNRGLTPKRSVTTVPPAKETNQVLSMIHEGGYRLKQ